MLTGILLIIVALLLFYVACRALKKDVQNSYEASMAAEMSFSTTWLLASFISLFGVMMVGNYTWWCFIPGIIFLYLLSAPVRIYIKGEFMGRNLDDINQTSEKGFSSFSQSIDKKDDE